MKRKTIPFILLSTLLALSGCSDPNPSESTLNTEEITKPTEVIPPSTSPEPLPTWNDRELTLMDQHLAGQIVPYFTIENAHWTYLKDIDALVYAAENVDYSIKEEYVLALADETYIDTTEAYQVQPGQSVLENHFDINNEFNYIQCQVGVVNQNNEYISSGSGFFMAAFFLNEAVTTWDENRINSAASSIAQSEIKLPTLSPRNEIKHIDVYDTYLILNIFQITIYGSDVVEEYKTLLKAEHWTILEDSASTYLAYDENKTLMLDVSYNEKENATLILVQRYVETYIQWPADTIADYMTKMGLENVLIPEPEFNFPRLSYELKYVADTESEEGPSLTVFANGGTDALSYKNTLEKAGWILIDEFFNAYELKNDAANTAIMIFPEEYYTVINIYPYVDPTLFPTEEINKMLHDLNLDGVNIPAIDADVKYQIDYIEGDELFTLNITGENFIPSYQETLRQAGFDVYASDVGITAFDPTDSAEILIYYNQEEGFAEMEVKAKEEGSKTWPKEELDALFQKHQIDIVLPSCDGFYYQLYLNDINLDGSIGIYVWTRDTNSLTSYIDLLLLDGWIQDGTSYSKNGYRIELYDSILDTAGAISIFLYPPQLA